MSGGLLKTDAAPFFVAVGEELEAGLKCLQRGVCVGDHLVKKVGIVEAAF